MFQNSEKFSINAIKAIILFSFSLELHRLIGLSWKSRIMDDSVRGNGDFANCRSMYRNLLKLKICSNADSKSYDSKIDRKDKELQALYALIESLDNKLARTQKKKSIKRATQLAADLDHIDSALKLRQAQVEHLKSEIWCLDNEIAKFSAVHENTDTEKQIKAMESRLLNNIRKKDSLKVKTSQLETVVTDMLLKRQKFSNTRRSLITDLMVKKREIDEIFNSDSTTNPIK